MTERTTREEAASMLDYATELERRSGMAEQSLYSRLARDYIALLDENHILALAMRDIAFGNLSPEENERIASDAWYTAKEVTGGRDKEHS